MEPKNQEQIKSDNLDLKKINTNQVNNIPAELNENKVEIDSTDNNLENNSNTQEEIKESIDTNEKEILESNNKDQIKEDDITVSPANVNTSSKSDDRKSHMSDTDLYIEEKLIKIIESDGIGDIYNKLNEQEKLKFKEEEYKASIKLILIIKSIGTDLKKGIKKAISQIFKITFSFLSSIKHINNRAYVDKITKIKVDRIIDSIENDEFSKKN